MPVSSVTSTAALAAQSSITKSSEMNAKAMSELATGSRISRASDAAAEGAIGAKIRSTVSVLGQASRNTSQGASLIQVGTDALKNISNVLTRMKTLSTQVINGSLSDSDKMMAREEFLKLKDLVDNVANQTRWNGISMLSGGAGKAVLARTGVSVTGETASANSFAVIADSDLTGSINGKILSVDIGDYNSGVVSIGAIRVTMQNGEVFSNKGVVTTAANGTFTLTSTTNEDNSMKITFNTSVSDISSAATFKTGLETLLQTATFSGSAVQATGATASAQGGVTSGASTNTYGFDGTLAASSSVAGKFINASVSAAMTAATGGTTTIAELNNSFAANPTTTGAVDLTQFQMNSASNNAGVITFTVGSETYSGTAVLTANNPTTFRSTTNYGRTIVITNDATVTDITTAAAYATKLNTFLATITAATPGVDAQFASDTISVTLSDGKVYRNDSAFVPSASDSLVLTDQSGGLDTITLTLGSNVSGITQTAAYLSTNLTTTLASSAFYAATNSGSVTANGLSADTTYGFTSVVRGSSGFISGAVNAASVVADGNKFKISVTVGNQTFKNTVDAPTNNGSLELISSTDSENKLVLQYGTTVSTSMATAATFNAGLRSFLGLQNGTAPAAFKADSAATGGSSGIDGISAGPAVSAGKYSLSYKANADGVSGVMKLSDGVNISYADVSASGKQTISFDNGISIKLGAAFQANTTLTPRVFDIVAGDAMSFDFQVAEKSSDLLTVEFASASLASLGLSDIDIGDVTAAQEASDLIDAAQSSVNKNYAKLGAQQKQLEVNKDVLASNMTNMQAALSEFVDADVPEAMTRMGSSSVQFQIASAMLVQANERTQQLLSMVR